MGPCLCKNENQKFLMRELNVENLTMVGGNMVIYEKKQNCLENPSATKIKTMLKVRTLINPDDLQRKSTSIKSVAMENFVKFTTLRHMTTEKRSNTYLPELLKSPSKNISQMNTKKTFDEFKLNLDHINEDEPESKEDREEENNAAKEENENSVMYLDRVVSKEEEDMIKISLKKHFWFQEITDDMMRSIMEDLIECNLEPGKCLYVQGEMGSYFYVLKKGIVEALIDGVRVELYKDWDCFGELALIQKSERKETVRCVTTSDVFILDGEAFRNLLIKVNNLKLRERLNFLQLIPTLKALNSIDQNNIASYLKEIEYECGDIIMKKGDLGDKMFIIKEGCVSCQYKGKEIRKLYDQEFFGQNCILLDTKRSLDVVSMTKTIVYKISKKSLEEAFGSNYREIILLANFNEIISLNNFFSSMFEEPQIEELFKCFTMKVYRNGEIIYQKDKKLKKKLVMFIEGSLVQENMDTNNPLCSRGEIYGEEVLQDDENMEFNYIALSDCIVLEAPWELITKKLNMGLDKKPFNIYNKIHKLKKIFIFKTLSEPKLILLAKMMTKQKYQPGELIIKENTESDRFYLITKGRVQMTQKGKLVRELEEGSCFGENAIINNCKLTTSVSAISTVVCYQLLKQDFDMIIDSPIIREYLNNLIALQDVSIELKDLFYLKFLGKGKFGSVSLVYNKKNFYAIKAVSRRSAEKQKILCKYFSSERKIMLQLDHPFVVKMVKTLRNETHCFFLIEHVNGKIFDEYLNDRSSKKNPTETRFYVACIFIMIDYLNKKGIAHRDLKPANLVLDHLGYLKLIDFGTSKKITDFTHTIIGTPHYISPEIILGKGYSLTCDYWSIGICMFEIYFGCYPFGSSATDILEVYKDVLHKDLHFPGNDQNIDIKAVIKSLLSKKLGQRCCNLQKLKAMNLYADFQWEELLDFKMKAPYIPETMDLTKNLNTLNYPYELALINETNEPKKKLSVIPEDTDRNEFDIKWADEF